MRKLGLITLAIAAFCGARPAHADEPMPVPPGVFKGVEVNERLGNQLPLEQRFRDHNGKQVVLADVVRGDLPVLVTFNYSNCPQLCDLQLKGLVHALAAVRLTPGAQFRLVTIILAPGEEPARAARTRANYVKLLKEEGADVLADGWTFLVSKDGKDAGAIKAVAAAAGFGYRYDERQDQYAHPATLVAVSPSGIITRYVHGISPVGADVEATIIKAGLSESSASSGFVMSCFHWDPDGRAAWGKKLMRYGAFGFASVFLLILVAVWFVRRSRHPSGVTPS